MASTSNESESVQHQESDSARIIRPPIPQRRDTLLEGGYLGHSNNLRPPKRSSENANNDHSKKQCNFYKLGVFHKGTFDSARIVAERAQKWLMVNIERSVLTAAEMRLWHILNQDVYLKNLVCQNFIVWQVNERSREGYRYKELYPPVEFPYIAILDPRTGEKLKVCHEFDSIALLDFVLQFLSDHQNPTEGLSDTLLNSPEASSPLSSDVTPVQETSAIVEQNDTENTGDTMNRSKNDSKVDIKEALEDWKQFLGGENDPKLDLVIRLPNGERQEISWACSTKVKSLYLFIEGLGYGMKEYEIMNVHPFYTLSQEDLEKTLDEVNLCSRQVLFLQLKINVLV